MPAMGHEVNTLRTHVGTFAGTLTATRLTRGRRGEDGPMTGRKVGRGVVALLEKTDEAFDDLLYRPAVVKAFRWLPRWWQCDLARLSMKIDDRWKLGWWDDAGIAPGEACEACHRRAAIHVVGGLDDDEASGDFLDDRPIYLCGWCHISGPLLTEEDVQRELVRARNSSVSWRWRWKPD
jgi:hypothetical protein